MFGPPGPSASTQLQSASNILNCNNPQARNAKGQTILTCISNMSRSRSLGSNGPIEMTHPRNKKLLDKMQKDSEKLKKELLAIDELDAKMKQKKAKNKGRRSGKIASPTNPEYRIIVN